MTDPILLTFPPPAKPLSMNDGDTWTTRRQAREWRNTAHWYWCHAHPGVGPSGRSYPPAEIHTVIPFDTTRRRDPINFARTVKHIVDGLVTAGAWPDDTPNWVVQHIPTLTRSDLVIVHIRPIG